MANQFLNITMRVFVLTFIFLIFSALSFPFGISNVTNDSPKIKSNVSDYELLYEQMNLDGLINFDTFKAAYKKLNNQNNPVLTVIDFNLPSSKKRMYVLDMEKKEVLFVSYVAHGKNSGQNYATSFSNRNGSHKSSLGFYRTAGTYIGGNGYSLQLDGLEEGINDQARSRAIVIHGADYCSEEVIRSSGRLGRSFGCPALPRELTKPIINTIKGGSLVFIYADNTDYLAKSEVL